MTKQPSKQATDRAATRQVWQKARTLAVGGAVAVGLLAAWFVWRQQRAGSPAPPSLARDPSSPRSGWAARPEGATAGFVEGTVMDAKRAGLAGAAVVALEAAGSARTLSSLAATAEGDGDGRFRLGPLAPGRYRVTAAAAGHLPASRELSLAAGQTVRGADLVLEAGGFVLSGRVLDAGAGAIAGGRVRAHVYGEASDTTVALARTDRAGGYRLTLPRGFHELVADADGYAPARTAVWVVGQLSRDFRLIPAASIAGRVVHRGTASPVAQARVRLEPAWGLEVDTDAEGAFVFDALEPGDYQLHARAGRLAGQLASPVAARLGTRVEGVLLEVEPGRALAGRVRRAGGGPVAGATVAVVARGELRGETRSDDGGGFRFEGLLPGPHVVRAAAPGFLEAVRSASLAEQDLPGIDLELRAAAQVRGLVVDAQDRPCPAMVSVESDERRGKPVRAGDDGRFVLADLPPGEAALRAECGPRGRARLDLGQVAAGERREVTLRLSAEGLHVRGTVRWKDGSPAAGIEVTAGNLRADTGPEQTSTDPSGGYQLGPLPAGALVTVEARSPIATGADPASGRRTVRLTGPQDAAGVDFVLARSEGAIRGVVTGPGGAPLPGAVVAAQARTFTWAVTDQDGSFVLDGLAQDDHQLRAEYPGLVGEEKEVAAGRSDVRFQLRRGALLAGVVEGGSGRGAGFCSVWARPAAGNPRGQDADRAVCGPGGAFEVRGLQAGAYDLFASAIDGRSGGLPGIQLGEGQERRGLRVRIGGGLTAVGGVVDLESRRPIAGARVRAALEAATLEAVTDASGRFRIEEVPRGVLVDLEVQAPGHLSNGLTRVAPATGETLDFGVLPLLVERPGPPPTGRAGIILSVNGEGKLTVSGTIEDLPAGQAGVAKGDVLLAIDGHDLANVNLSTAVAMIRGPSGVLLTLQLRGPDQRVRTVRIVRA